MPEESQIVGPDGSPASQIVHPDDELHIEISPSDTLIGAIEANKMYCLRMRDFLHSFAVTIQAGMALQKGTVRQMLEINEEAAGRVVEFFKTAREQLLSQKVVTPI